MGKSSGIRHVGVGLRGRGRVGEGCVVEMPLLLGVLQSSQVGNWEYHLGSISLPWDLPMMMSAG